MCSNIILKTHFFSVVLFLTSITSLFLTSLFVPFVYLETMLSSLKPFFSISKTRKFGKILVNGWRISNKLQSFRFCSNGGYGNKLVCDTNLRYQLEALCLEKDINDIWPTIEPKIDQLRRLVRDCV